jgi:hypothetical protein
MLTGILLTLPAFPPFQNVWVFIIVVPVYLMKMYLARYFT